MLDKMGHLYILIIIIYWPYFPRTANYSYKKNKYFLLNTSLILVCVKYNPKYHVSLMTVDLFIFLGLLLGPRDKVTLGALNK